MSTLQTFSKVFNVDFQQKLAYIILRDRKFSDRICQVLNPRLLERKYLQIFVDAIFEYKKTYNRHPSIDILDQYIESSNYEINDALRANYKDFIHKVAEHKFDVKNSEEFIKDNALNFCRTQKVKEAMSVIDDRVNRNQCDFMEVQKIFDNAIRQGADNDTGSSYVDDFAFRYEEDHRETISTGWSVFDKIIDGGHGKGEVGIIISPTGGGKCYSKDTKVLMFDGSFKKASEVCVGDKLMGPDSSERTVLSLTQGRAPMYRIKPIKGEKWECNGAHKLCLINTVTNKEIAISVDEYLTKSSSFKHEHKLYQAPYIVFPDQLKPKVDPYFYGLWVGDGSKSKSQGVVITTSDSEIEEVCISESLKWGLSRNVCGVYGNRLSGISGKENILRTEIDKLWSDGSIDNIYKLGNEKTRLEFLAGFLDADGHLHHGFFEYSQKNKKTADDVAFIARSLGFRVTQKTKIINDTVYYRNNILGDVSRIPTKISRKQAEKRKQKKNVLRTGFSIECIGIDEYYGWENDKDHKHLLWDFTVSHNSMNLVHVGASALKQGKNVVYYTLELNEKIIERRFDACLTGICLNDLMAKKDIIEDKIKKIPGKLITKKYPRKRASIIDLKSHLDRLLSDGFDADMVICDYADLLVSQTKGEKRYQDSEAIYDDFISMIEEYNVAGWTASQTNRTGLEKQVITMDAIADAYNKCHGATLIFSSSRTMADKNTNKAKFYIAKNRNGKDGMVLDVRFNAACVDIEVLEEHDPEAIENRDSEQSVLKRVLKKNN